MIFVIYILCMCVEGVCTLGGQSSTCKSWSFLSPMGTGVANVQLDFDRCPCSPSHPLSSTPGCHRPQNLLWTQHHTRVDGHFESPASLASRDMQALLETSPSVPSCSFHLWPSMGRKNSQARPLLPPLAPSPCSQYDTSHSINEVCPATDLSLRLDP